MNNAWFGAAALLAALGVALGAFGAHALKRVLSPELLEVWRTATHYHLVHAVALAALALARVHDTTAGMWGVRLLWVGTVVFAGTLYVLCLSGQRWLGAVTPLGGSALIAGWLALAWAGWSTPRG